MAYWESNGHVTDDVSDPEGQTRHPNSLRLGPLERNISKTAGDAIYRNN